MALPIAIKRGNPIALDTTSVWYVKADMENYAKTGATAYVGQIITYVNEEGGTVEAYQISNKAGALIKLASTTASGDLAGDIAALKARVTVLEGLMPTKVNSVKATDASITATTTSGTEVDSIKEVSVKANISTKEKNILKLEGDGLYVPETVIPEVTVPVYSLVKESASEDSEGNPQYAAVYHLTKDGANVGDAINIPKDLVVQSGTVEKKTEAGDWGEAGTYIVLILNDKANTPIYIPATSLVDAYTGKDGTTIKVDVSDSNEISAEVKDKSITKAKLAQTVQDSLDKADTALQAASITSGTDNGTIAVKGTDVAVTGLKDAAFETVANIQKGAVGTAKSYTDTEVGKVTTALGKTDETVAAVKATAEKNTTDLAALTTTVGTKANADKVAEDIGKAKTELIGTDKDASTADTIAGAKKHADEAVAALKGKADDSNTAETVMGARKLADDNYTKAHSEVEAAKTGLLGTASDDENSNTIHGAKAYAKAYADEKIAAATPGIATEATAGLVKSTKADATDRTLDNTVNVAADGKMKVSAVNVNTLYQTSGDILILNGGSATI